MKKRCFAWCFTALLLCGLFCGLICFNAFYQNDSFKPKIANAKLDLSENGITSPKKLSLEGEWEIYYDKFIVSDGLAEENPDDIVMIPKINKQQFSKAKFVAASYRLLIYNFHQDTRLFFQIPGFSGAYRIFVNDKLISSSGTISHSSDDFRISGDKMTEAFEFKTGQSYMLTIEVSFISSENIYISPLLSVSTGRWFFDYLPFLLIVLLAMLFVSIVLFLMIGKKENITLLLPLMLGCIALRLILTRQMMFIFGNAFFDIVYETLNPFVIPLNFAVTITGVLFFSKYGRYKIPLSLQILLYITSALAVISYMALPETKASSIVFWIFASLFMLICFLLLTRTKDGQRRGLRDFAILASILFILTGLFATGDVLNSAVYKGESLFIISSAISVFMIFISSVQYIGNYKKMEIELLSVQKEAEQAKISILLSQIKPHFLYNALNAVLCVYKKSFSQGEDILVKFSNYLRANMDSIEVSMIPFAKELQHIKNYVDIEQIRFGDRLKIVYDITEMDFSLPPLSVQPLIENAINHGVCKKVEGGTVTLKTFTTQDEIIIEVKDNGVGFDTNSLEKADKTRSIGLRNIQSKLKMIPKATLQLQSVIGSGTTITIRLAKEIPEIN